MKRCTKVLNALMTVLTVMGFLVILGTAGQSDFDCNSITTEEVLIRMTIGVVLIAIPFVIAYIKFKKES